MLYVRICTHNSVYPSGGEDQKQPDKYTGFSISSKMSTDPSDSVRVEGIFITLKKLLCKETAIIILVTRFITLQEIKNVLIITRSQA